MELPSHPQYIPDSNINSTSYAIPSSTEHSYSCCLYGSLPSPIYSSDFLTRATPLASSDSRPCILGLHTTPSSRITCTNTNPLSQPLSLLQWASSVVILVPYSWPWFIDGNPSISEMALVPQWWTCFLWNGPVFCSGSPGSSMVILVPQWRSWFLSKMNWFWMATY